MTQTFSDDLALVPRGVYEPMVELRHDFHAHPELSFQEHRTTDAIRDRLVALGWDLRPCPTDTGVVAHLKGAKTGKRVMIRADIDGLPIQEDSDLSFSSTNDGVMHACGHDIHTAGLLGVADILSRRHDELAGEFTLLFQPAEELIGGAKAMIDGGLLVDNPVDALIGAHVTSLAPVGLVATRSGIMMSEACSLSVHVHGRGGHGAMATTEGNVVLAISALAPQLGEIVKGLSFENVDCACSAGVIAAGTANNVVPRHALLQGTLRTFTAGQQEQALGRLRDLLKELEERFVVTTELRIDQGTKAVINDDAVTTSVMASARHVVGSDNVTLFPPVTPSDDVAEFLALVPGCYLFIGGAMDDGSSGMHHSPDFSIDDRALRVVAGVLAASAIDLASATR